MSSKAYWVEKPWIMSADYEGRVTVQDYEVAMGECLAVLKEQPVYFVVDLSKSITLPLQVTMISSLLELVNHRNTMAFAFIGANRFAKLTIPTMIRKPYRFFESREPGMVYLRDMVAREHPQELPSTP